MRNTLTSALIKTTLATGIALLLTACGGGSGGSSSSTTGTLNLAITDAPIDDAKKVVVQFTGVELQGPSGRIDRDFEDGSGNSVTMEIDLLALTEGATEDMLKNVILEAGQYNWMRLKVNAEKGMLDSYIKLKDDSLHSLHVPSGSQTGLKLNSGFVVPAGGVASYTIDFDLRKSVHKPSSANQDYKLRPTLRLVDNISVGTLKGTVSNDLIEIECGGAVDGAVYVFNTEDTVDDLDGTGDPITSATLKGDGSEPYTYTVAFLEKGDYNIAFTCDAAIDDPVDDQATTDVSFSGETTVTIETDTITTHDFEPAPAPEPTTPIEEEVVVEETAS